MQQNDDYFDDLDRLTDGGGLNWVPQNGNYGGNGSNDAWLANSSRGPQ